jgi:hypothetical protein
MLFASLFLVLVALLLVPSMAVISSDTGDSLLMFQPEATLQAGANGDFNANTRIYGPEDGDLLHDPSAPFIKLVTIDREVADFVAEVVFINPYSASDDDWSHGFLFRQSINGQYRLIFDSNGSWELIYVDDDDFDTVQSGELPDFEDGKDSKNSLRLAVDGDSGLFAFNGEIIEELDLSEHTDVGALSIGTGFYEDSEAEGARTGYRDFTVWSIGLLPTPTPTATPVAAARPVIVGENRGEIAVGGGELWTFEGLTGETWLIRAEARRPAGTFTTTDERIEQELLDSYLIVRAPDGSIIGENDDDERLADDNEMRTNARVVITLPEDGIYTIEVRSYADESGGEYTLVIEARGQLNPIEATPTLGREGRP